MVSVFIRTYEGDLDWLRYCLASLHRNLSGWDEIVICIPEGQEHKLRELITDERVVTCPVYADDYIGQQVSKLQAYRHVRGELILFVDSDIVFHPGSDVSAYFQDGKPVILKESYKRIIAHGQVSISKWQEVVYRAFGKRPSHEYMRRAPQLFRTETLVSLDRALPRLEAHALSQPYRLFSEFNILGYYAEMYQPAGYVFLDLEHEAFPPNPATQNWSWGGITPVVFAQLIALGVADPSQPPDFSQLPPPPEVPKPLSSWRRFRHAIKRFLRGY